MKRPPEVSLMLAPQVSMGTSAIRPMAVRLLVKYPTDYPDRYVMCVHGHMYAFMIRGTVRVSFRGVGHLTPLATISPPPPPP